MTFWSFNGAKIALGTCREARVFNQLRSYTEVHIIYSYTWVVCKENSQEELFVEELEMLQTPRGVLILTVSN